MASPPPVCGICDLRHINKVSMVWCFECDEGLCDECTEHHDLSKGTRKHKTISIAEYKSLPQNILQIKENCEEHNEKFQLFCKNHDRPCCRICAVDKHSKCDDVTAIERVLQNVKTSNIFQETESLINEILETIVKIRLNRNNNSSSFQEMKKNVEKEMLAFKTNINKHLDQIQDALCMELDELETRVEKQTNDVLTALIVDEKQLTGHQTTMSSIKKYATDLQVFLSIHRIDRSVRSCDESIHKLLKTEAMADTTLSWQINKTIQEFATIVSTFGKITVKKHPCKIVISRGKIKQAQIIAAPPKPIGNIVLRPLQTIYTKGTVTSGCVLLADGRMMFSCSGERRIRSFNKDGSRDFTTGRWSSGRPWDIAYIDDTKTIAISSSGFGNSITIVDIETGKCKKNIPTKTECDGVVFRNDTLVYSTRSSVIGMLNIEHETLSEIDVEQMSSGFAYITTYRDKLYYTNGSQHTVTCCDLNGNTQWQFKDENILIAPLGITVDNDGNLYVVGSLSCNVVVISSDGQQRRQLLCARDGIDDPQVIFYEKSTNRLLVANRKDSALLFQVLRKN